MVGIRTRDRGREIEAHFYGGRPTLRDDEVWVERIPLVLNDQWEWVPPVEIQTTEYPSGRRTGRFVRLMARSAEAEQDHPVYIWEPA